MEKKEYLENPTDAFALFFWKTCKFKTPAHIKVLNENEFNQILLETYTDEVYFKLVHYLDDVEKQIISDKFIFAKSSTEDFVNHINSCHEDEVLTVSELEFYKKKPVYDEELRICLYDKKNDAIVATGIAEFDDEIKEGYLDWIQVSEQYRRQCLGKAIVY